MRQGGNSSDVSISVVIPTRNRPTMLGEALASVSQQTKTPHEVIVVNNGHTPVSTEAYSDIKVIEIMRDAGAAQARNIGALCATGQYIAFLDDDDLWESEYLAKLSETVSRTDADYVIARLDRLVDGKITPYRQVDDVSTLLKEVWITNPGVGGPNSIVRREAFLRVGGYDPQLVTSEDRSLIAEFLLHGLKVEAAPDMQAIARVYQGDRLTNPGRMAEGKRRFLAKYAKEMTTSEKLRNRAVIELQQMRADRNPLRLLLIVILVPVAALLRRLDSASGS